MPSPGISTSSSASSSRPSTAPMRSPSTGMSTAPSPADQSTSNQSAYGESGPSASTDHSARLCQTGVGTAMWLGTMSSTSPRPASCAAAASRRSAGSPPSSGAISSWSTTSYPCVDPGAARRIGDRYTCVTPERREVRDALHRVVERQVRAQLQPVGRARHGPARRRQPAGRAWGAVRSCAGARLGGAPLRLLVGRLPVPTALRLLGRLARRRRDRADARRRRATAGSRAG